ncbi:hypothetical protein NQZ79_g748 [Umbelopsis isabellina]|nr:hypothetical protein NQZ79_g748 [Umbelopsis isabellina]
MKIYGVTPPISEAKPSEREWYLNRSLNDVLVKERMVESEERTKLRESVLFELGLIVNDFVYQVTAEQQPQEVARLCVAKLFTYGSYRLGAHSEDSDIDTLCVCPRHIWREHFFTRLSDILRRRPEVSELTAVSNAFVPVIKMVFSGIHIDLIYAKLKLPTIPADLDLNDDQRIGELDAASLRTINGPRTASEILALVPNVETFRSALKCIKLWARRRCIYSNAMGFLGGVAWAILVARVCQLYPNGCSATIISRFFRIFSTWSWPSPVVLKQIQKVNNAWDQKKSKHHIMPIITPTNPALCSTHNVTKSTMLITLAELRRASSIVDQIMLGTTSWQKLFEDHDFFDLYTFYVRLNVCSMDPSTQLAWCGRIESRLRHLVSTLEARGGILVAHPLTDGATKEHFGLSYKEIQDVAFSDTVPNELSNSQSTYSTNDKSTRKLYVTKYYIGLLLRPLDGNA